MEPLTSTPTLFSINGFGFRMVGKRDRDEATNSYVATHFISALYIPLIALGAYRIAETAEGDYFIGKETLSGLAKFWNLLICASIISVVGAVSLQGYLGGDAYQAKKAMEQADNAMAENRIGEAAFLYKKVFTGHTKYKTRAGESLQRLNDARAFLAATPYEALKAVKIFVSLHKSMSGVFENAWELFEVYFDKDPVNAKTLLNIISSIAPDKAVVEEKRYLLLEKLVEMEPDVPGHAIALSMILEAKGDYDRCEALLSPHASKLGKTEGARILGRIYASQNKIQASHDLLLPYTRGKLALFHKAEKAYDKALDDEWKKTLQILNDGKGPQSFYDGYDKADESEQNAMVQQYHAERIAESPRIDHARQAYRNAAKIVPVALDMGIIMLRRAREMPDAAERKKELEAAKNMFLAVKGAAGESDEYRLYLGQVHYWLGESEKGKTLFEELLEAKNRDADTLRSVASTLRNVGEISESKKLLLEAYEKAETEEDKKRIAQFLSVLASSTKEKIDWLEKSDAESSYVKAELSNLRAREAARLNKRKDAIRLYQEAIDTFNQLPETAAMLNNVALVYFNKHGVTGDKKDFEEGLKRLEKALDLSPDDSILLQNVIGPLIASACGDVIGDKIDLGLIQSTGSLALLGFLHNGETRKNEYASELANHPGITKALSYLEKGVLLAPKSPESYQQAYSIHSFTADREGLARVAGWLDNASLDHEEQMGSEAEYISGENDAFFKETYQKKSDRLKKNLSRVHPKKKKTTYSVVVSEMIDSTIALSILGAGIDYGAALKMAEKNYRRSPSSSTRDDLTNVLARKIIIDVSKKDSGLKRLETSYTRSLGSEYLIGIALDSPATAPAITRNKDFKRYVVLIKEKLEKRPDRTRALDWSVLRHVSPELAKKASDNIVNNDLYDLKQSIQMKLTPYRPSTVYAGYLDKLFNGKEVEGVEFLRKKIEEGIDVPLPANARG